MKTMHVLPLAALLLAACVGGPTPNVATFDECLHAGYPIMESFPRRCAVPGGPTFVETLPPSIEDLASFTGSLLDVAGIDTEGNTFFRFQTPEGPEHAVLEPEAEFATDIRAVASGSGLLLRGWRDGDGVVHVVEVEITD